MKKTNKGPHPNLGNSRKAIRKQKRQVKKLHRQEHYLKKKTFQEKPSYEPGKFVKRPADDQQLPQEIKKKKQKPSIQDVITKEIQKEKNETLRLKEEMDKQRKKMLLQANEEEDKVIKKLEKQLGLNKSKNKNNRFADDGLDYLLEICDRTTSEQIVAAEKHLANVEDESDFDEDLAVVTGGKLERKKKYKEVEKNKETEKDKKNDKENNDVMSDSNEEFDDIDNGESNNSDDDIDGDEYGSGDDLSDLEEDDEMSEDEPEVKPTKSIKSKKESVKSSNNQKVVSEEDLSKVFSEDEVSHLSGDDGLDNFSGDDDNENHNDNSAKEKPDVWEDIYGRKRDKDGNIIKEEKGIYIPPHLRNKGVASDKDLALLKRQIKSVLNKLAGTNLHWACTSIENLYSNNSRNSVNTALTELWMEATVAPSHTPDRMVAEHAALVSVLHANVATEIGAHFLQELCKKFDAMMQTPQPVEDKRLDNLVSCLGHLYCFKIYHASLLYDIFGRLMDEISEKNIECVLVALRSVGGVLRKEEPLALKNFIHETQAKVAKLSSSAANGSRIKFLLEVLLAVKNNNLNKIPGYEPTYAEQLRKQARAAVRRGNYGAPLHIRLHDLLQADEKGKWWIVGSAWEGNQARQEDKTTVKLPATTDQKLLELARKQRMNTDVRRSIFCVIMSAEDYMDAFEKLQHLGLRGQQEREIVHVLLACCLQERTYNPYYAVLGQKLCDTDRRYQLSIQYSVWDKIKELENLSKQSSANLAQLLVHLIMEKGLPLSVLKVIEFSDLNKATVRFMRQILLAIIMNENLQTCLEVFHRISKPAKLHMFRESIRLFIQHFLIKNMGKQSNVLSAQETAKLKERAVEVDKILTMYESKLRL
ncbi:nucleolar MIF4G domain-containing protein 1 homolog [Galleria mellonella]|uniref:Nucleolar MIF4G domain-containing protein 1 homolog n=1 Tax=Galleria mellonella TaxID=7137 RepID=A0A6J1WMC6_GALME|nr:nucleolar MIF4G domain-containing protein 1 homolog [Galleria mellonella]